MQLASVDKPREVLLAAVHDFVCGASELPAVLQIALVGSLATRKLNPKDADLLVKIKYPTDLSPLAAMGRRLQGRAQSINLGADIFLVNALGEYIGRTCRFRECHPRALCNGAACRPGSYLCDDRHVFSVRPDVVREPPIELWPRVVRRTQVPADVEAALLVRLEAGAKLTESGP